MSNNHVQPETTTLPYFVARYEGRAVAIKRDTNYQGIIQAIQGSVPKLRSVEIQNIFVSTTLTDYGDTLVQISEGIWPDLVDHLKTVEITVDPPADINHVISGPVDGQTRNVAPALPNENAGTTSTTVSQDTHAPTVSRQDIGEIVNMLLDPISNPILITIMTPSQQQLRFDMVRTSTKIRTVKLLIESRYGPAAALQKLEFLQNPLDDDQTLEECGIGSGASINLILTTRQMAIYLPTPLSNDSVSERTAFNEVKVQLSVNRAWELAALRSPTEVPLRNDIQSGTWVVDITGHGSLLHRDSGTSRICLLWDGIVPLPRFSTAVPSLPQNQTASLHLTHSPAWLEASTTIGAENSVLVPIHRVGSYVSTVFSSFDRHFGQDLLRHLLPQLQSRPYTHVAFRFLHRAESESLTVLNITPAPAAVSRITMLYKGVNDQRTPIWGTSLVNSAHAADWSRLTGVGGIDLPMGSPGFGAYVITWLEVL